MNVAELRRGEIIAAVGGLLLAISVFLPWYGTADDNPNANIDGARGDVSCWDAHPLLRWLMLLAAIAPFILVWIILRGHELSWARGEMTAVVAIAALGLVVYNGVIDRPGEPSSEIGLRYGWFVALLGTLLMFAGGAIRSSEHERVRKPPGVL